MATGIVKWWNDEKGYGIITTEWGEDIFVHSSAIQAQGFQSLKDGSTVVFDVRPGPNGQTAYNVSIPGVPDNPSSLQRESPHVYAASFSAPTVRQIGYQINEHMLSSKRHLVNISITQSIDGQGYVALAVIKRG